MKHRTVWSIVNFVHDKVMSDPRYEQFPVPILEAHAFRSVLEQLPIGLPPNEFLAGDFGWGWGDPHRLMELERQIEEEQRSHNAFRPPASPVELLRDYFHCFGSYTTAHTCVDYERVISEGIAGILEQLRRFVAAWWRLKGRDQDRRRSTG